MLLRQGCRNTVKIGESSPGRFGAYERSDWSYGRNQINHFRPFGNETITVRSCRAYSCTESPGIVKVASIMTWSLTLRVPSMAE